MRVAKTDMICGLEAPKARLLMCGYQERQPAEVAAELLGMDVGLATERLRALEGAGYLEHLPDDYWPDGAWTTTISGNALAQASFGKPIARATAERLLAGALERVRGYNADSAKALTVTQLVVFGSYLDAAADSLGDLDLAMSYVRRPDIDLFEYARASGRSFSGIGDEVMWPLRELMMAIKNRSTAINITIEDVSQITDRFETVYSVGDDPRAFQPPLDAAS